MMVVTMQKILLGVLRLIKDFSCEEKMRTEKSKQEWNARNSFQQKKNELKRCFHCLRIRKSEKSQSDFVSE
jgi:hypothetical protein